MASCFVYVTQENVLYTNEAAKPDNTKNPTKFGIEVFGDLYLFYLLAMNTLRMCSKCFVYNWRAGDKPMFGKIVLEI